jgi:hypothetical protein
VGGGIVNQQGTLTMAGCTLSNNAASGAIAGYGGGIVNSGTANVSDSTFSGNTASGATNYGAGGAIYNTGSSQAATLSVSNSLFSSNSASGVTAVGGAINNESGRATTTITDSTFSGNSVSSGRGAATGGAIENSGTLDVTGTTIRDNTAVSGGGIYNNGTMTASNSTFEGNQASSAGGVGTNGSATIKRCTFSNNFSSYGGGLAGFGGAVTVTNSTFTGNSADSGGSNLGGAILAFGLTLLDSTLSGNSAGSGGGLFAPSSSTLVRNTIIAGNTASFGPDVAFTFTSQGHNLIGDGRDGSGYVSTDLVGTTANPIDPKLGPLQDNGGPTPTMALLPGSPAVDAGDSSELGVADQRGVVRSGGVNIGAYQASASAFVLTAPDTVTAGAPFDVTVTAVDPFGQVALGYTGTVTFSTSDPDLGVVLPPNYTFQPQDNGVALFSSAFSLITPGPQTITATDTSTGANGSATVTVNAPGAPGGGAFFPPSPLDQLFAGLNDAVGFLTSKRGDFVG